MALGPVKPWVKTAADALAAKFSIKTMYGWRPVDPFPDHPSGLAVDFMINSKANGDQLAAYVVQNASALNVKYLIWYRQEWSVKNPTWRPYTSSTNPHTDHVHVTFNNTAGGSIGSLLPVGNTDVGMTDSLAQFLTALRSANTFFRYINDPGNWRRISIGAVGVMFILFGFIKFDKVAGLAANAIQKVGKNGAK